jgi:hypothetical protein
VQELLETERDLKAKRKVFEEPDEGKIAKESVGKGVGKGGRGKKRAKSAVVEGKELDAEMDED